MNETPDIVRPSDRRGLRIDLFWSDEDGGWIANAPDMEFCSAFGISREKALTELCRAVDARRAAKTAP